MRVWGEKEEFKQKGEVRTSLSCLTLLVKIPTCSLSFWLSNSSRTAALYWPREFGVAARNGSLPPPPPPALVPGYKLPLLDAPGYAEKDVSDAGDV
jgi:hypothetical protein